MNDLVIQLDGFRYVTVGHSVTRGGRKIDVNVERSDVAPFGEVFRTVGVQQQQDLQQVSTKVFGPLTGGMGLSRVASHNANSPLEYTRFWDATADTRWPGDVRLGILDEASVDPATSVIRASCVFKGNLWSIWEDANQTISRRYVGNTTTWTAGALIAAAFPNVGLDMIQYKTGMIVLIAGNTGASNDDHQTFHSTDGTTWNSPATDITANLLTSAITANDTRDAGLLTIVGGEAVAVVWDEDGGTITFFSKTTLTGNWTDEAVDIPSGNGPQGVAVYPGTDGSDKLYVATKEGLWEVDTAPATWTLFKVFNMSSNTDNGRRMTVHNGALWFAQGVGNSEPAKIWRMTVSADTRSFEAGPGISLDADDGVTSELLGPVRWMKSTGLFLYASIGGGAASRNARVICHNSFGWHTVYREGTANQKVEWIDVAADDDGVERLHFARRTATTTSDTKFLAYPNTNPTAGVSIKRQTSSYIDLPEIDGGMATTSAAWLRAAIAAVDVTTLTTGEWIDVTHGLDGAARTTVDLGDIISTTKSLDYASGAGAAGVSDAIRLVLNRAGTDTNTPKFRHLEMAYLKLPPDLEKYEFIIDLEATARLEINMIEGMSVETIKTRLSNAHTKTTLPTLQYANSGVLYVRAYVGYAEDVQDVGAGGLSGANTFQVRGGYAVVRCEEIT